MSTASDDSNDNLDTQDEKDEDFKVDDYQKDLDSDDSYCDIPEANNDENEAHSEDEHNKCEENDDVGPVLPGGHRLDKKLICVKYPGNVVNPEKAIETLGGMSNISTAINTPNRRLELRFRPDDIYCKPACGDKHNTNGFLLRVRIKKSQIKKSKEADLKKKKKKNTDFQNTGSSDDNKNEQSSNYMEKKQMETECMTDLIDQVQSCSVGFDESPSLSNKGLDFENDKDSQDASLDASASDLLKTKKNIPPTFDRDKYADLSKDKDYELPKLKILGRVDTEFRFTNLCDFQYLPMTQNREDPKKLECIYDKIYPTNLPRYSWLKNDVPYFLPPAAFSRMDTVQQYVPKTEINSYPENIIGKNRKRKAGYSNFIYFSTAEVPTKPPESIETVIQVKFVQNAHLQQMREIFEERPIWSKNAIMYKTKFSTERLKILLPSVAYYFMTGPWKIMWVKLGYDPRKDVSARKYQTLDYRLKAMHGLGSTVKCKRSYSEYTLPYKSTPVSKQKTIIQNSGLFREPTTKKEQDLHESIYIYREGSVPPSRQMFYQYCDVLVDEIQEMLAKLPDPLPGTKCHEKRGWLPIGFDAQCREIINKQVRAVLRKQMNIPEDHPTSLPKKRRYRFKLRGSKLKGRKRKKKTECSSSEEESEQKHDKLEPSTATTDNE